jgi:acyl-coenzyme A thioesterase PaaI-like protein
LSQINYPPDLHIMRDLRPWTERDDDGARCHLEVTPQMHTSSGVLRSGVLAILADMAAGEGAVRAANPHWVATSDLVLHVTNPVVEGIVVARPSVLRRSRSTVVLEVDLSCGEMPVALGTLTFAVLPARPGAKRMGAGADEPRTEFGRPGSVLAVPLAEALEVRIVDARAGVAEIPLTPYVGNSLGALQGGVSGMLIEFGAEAAARELLGRDVSVSDLTINYLSLVREGPARTRTRLLRQGDDEVLLRVELHDPGSDDRLCSVATVCLRA